MTAMTSGSAARALRAPAPVVRPRALRLVPQRRSSAARAPFAVVVVVLLVGGLLGLLMLNTMVAQGVFRLHDLTVQGKVLDDREEVLSRQVQTLQAPTSLSQRATAFGMVPGGPPMFLRLSDGAVLGIPGAPAAAAPAPPAPAPAAPATAPAGAPKALPTTAASARATTRVTTAPKTAVPSSAAPSNAAPSSAAPSSAARQGGGSRHGAVATTGTGTSTGPTSSPGSHR
jgi:cytoskeletal protein RodZ